MDTIGEVRLENGELPPQSSETLLLAHQILRHIRWNSPKGSRMPQPEAENREHIPTICFGIRKHNAHRHINVVLTGRRFAWGCSSNWNAELSPSVDF